MLRLKNLSNKYQKRTCRPVYANTQATPYAATLHVDPAGTNGFRTATGALRVPPTGVTAAYVAANGGSLHPGTVLARIKGTEQVTVATGAEYEQPFGLLANFVGGQFDEGFEGDSLQNQVGVWRGPDAVFEVLAPAFGDITIADGISAGTKTTNERNTNHSATGGNLLWAGTDGRLTNVLANTTGNSANVVPVARLVELVGTSRIVVDLIV